MMSSLARHHEIVKRTVVATGWAAMSALVGAVAGAGFGGALPRTLLVALAALPLVLVPEVVLAWLAVGYVPRQVTAPLAGVLGNLVYPALGLSVVLVLYQRREAFRGVLANPVVLLCVALLAWLAASAMGTADGSAVALQRLRDFVLFSAVPAIGIGALGSDPRRSRRFAWSCAGVGAITVVLSLVELAQQGGFDANPRFSVLGINTISYSFAVAAGVLFMGFAAVHILSRPVRLALLTLALLGVVFVVASNAREVLLAVVAGGALYSLVSRRFGRFVIFALMGVVVTTFASQFARSDLTWYYGYLTDDLLLSSSVQSRVVAWETSWSLFVSEPVTGVGLGGITDVGLYGVTYAHNLVLELAAETGFIGAALFLLAFCAAARSAMRLVRTLPPLALMRELTALYAAVLITLAAGAAISTGVDSATSLWVPMAAIAALDVGRGAPTRGDST